MWGHCLPVKVLALSARRPFGSTRLNHTIFKRLHRLLDLPAQAPNQMNLHINHLQFLVIDLRIQLGEDMVLVKQETCSPQRLRRLLDPPAQQATTILATCGAISLTGIKLNSRSLIKISNRATTSFSTCQQQREGW